MKKQMHKKGCPICEEQIRYWSESEAKQAVWSPNGSSTDFDETAQEKLRGARPPKSFDNLQVGDVIYDEDNNEHKVTAVKKYYEITHNGYTRSFYPCDRLEIIYNGYTLSPPEKMVPLKKVMEKLKELAE